MYKLATIAEKYQREFEQRYGSEGCKQLQSVIVGR